MFSERRLSVFPFASGVVLACSGIAHAQIATDGTLGAGGAIGAPNYAITASLGRQVGTNLFHSFATFNLAHGESATFSGPSGIANVISRVTGASASNIDGLIRSTIAGANLFLINPKGILFGPNASLDLTGSFHASTASYLKLADGGRFDAIHPDASVLTTAPPAAFGFLGPAPAPITVQGSNLTLPAGSSLSLVGGPITVTDAAMRTVAGDVRLFALGGAGEAPINATGAAPTGTPPAPISIERSALQTEGTASAAPGRIVIRGGQISVANSRIASVNAGSIDASAIEIAAASDLNVTATTIASEAQSAGSGADIALSGERVQQSRTTDVRSEAAGSGRGGDIMVSAVDSFRLISTAADDYYSELISRSSGGGPAGAIAATADAIVIQSSNIYSETRGSADARPVTFSGRSVEIKDGTYVYSQAWPGATGRGADLTVDGRVSVFVGGRDWGGFAASVFTETYGSGHGGNIRMSAPEISVTGGSVYSKTYASGNAGGMRFEGETVRFLGGNEAIAFIDTTAWGGSSGNGGDIEVRAAREIEVSRADYPQDWSRVSSSSFSSGRGGNILLDAPSIKIAENASIWTQATDSGRGGSITLRGGTLQLRDGGELHTHTSGSGDAGHITLSGRGIQSEFGKFDSYSVGSGRAGDITLDAAAMILGGTLVHSFTYAGGDAGHIRFTGDVMRFGALPGRSTWIESAASNGTTGRSGDIEFRATRRLEVDGSAYPVDWTRVAATTQGSGRGGNILVEAPSIEIREATFFSRTRFGSGDQGGIVVRAGDLSVINGEGFVALTEGTRDGSFIRIDAKSILLEGESPNRGASRIVAATGGSGNAGNITINAQRLKMGGSSSIDATSDGSGNAGSIVLNLTDTFEMSGRDAGVEVVYSDIGGTWRGGVVSRATASGNAGSVVLTAPNVLLDDGRIVLTVRESGRGGRVIIRADQLTLRNGGQVDTRSIAGSTGSGGSIEIDVAGRFEISGLSPFDGAFSAVNAEAQGSGSGGSIGIRADTLVLDRGIIRSSASGSGSAGIVSIRARVVGLNHGAWIDAGTAQYSSAAGGSIAVVATESIVVDGVDRTDLIVITSRNPHPILGTDFTLGRPQGPQPSTVSTNSAGSGRGGSITLSAPRIMISKGGQVSANSTSTGAAGSIFIQAADWLKLDSGSITTQALVSDGGNIDIRAGNMVRLTHAEISTSVGFGRGSGGNVFIDPTFVILEGSRIAANAFGGAGGSINIIANVFLTSPDSTLDASSQLGVPGSVQISAPQADAISGLPTLPAQFFDATGLLREACGGRWQPGSSRLVDIGRGGVALATSGYVASRYFGDDSAALGEGVEPAASNSVRSRTTTSVLLAGICEFAG